MCLKFPGGIIVYVASEKPQACCCQQVHLSWPCLHKLCSSLQLLTNLCVVLCCVCVCVCVCVVMRLTCRSNCSTIKACTLACARVRGLRLCSKARWLHYIYRALPNICLACTIYKYYMCWYMSNKQIVYVPPCPQLMSTKEVHSMLVLPIVLVLLEGICLSCGEISAHLLFYNHNTIASHCIFNEWNTAPACLNQHYTQPHYPSSGEEGELMLEIISLFISILLSMLALVNIVIIIVAICFCLLLLLFLLSLSF